MRPQQNTAIAPNGFSQWTTEIPATVLGRNGLAAPSGLKRTGKRKKKYAATGSALSGTKQEVWQLARAEQSVDRAWKIVDKVFNGLWVVFGVFAALAVMFVIIHS